MWAIYNNTVVEVYEVTRTENLLRINSDFVEFGSEEMAENTMRYFIQALSQGKNTFDFNVFK